MGENLLNLINKLMNEHSMRMWDCLQDCADELMDDDRLCFFNESRQNVWTYRMVLSADKSSEILIAVDDYYGEAKMFLSRNHQFTDELLDRFEEVIKKVNAVK